MRLEKQYSSLALLATLCAMSSACGQREPLQTASDFCLNDRRISAEPAPESGADDPGNQWDSEQTFNEVLAHNEVHDRLCGG